MIRIHAADPQEVYYRKGDEITKVKIVKVHLDDDLRPFYDVSVDGKEKQTDDAHLSPCHPLHCQIVESIHSMSETQLQDVLNFVKTVVGQPSSGPGAKGVSISPKPPLLAQNSPVRSSGTAQPRAQSPACPTFVNQSTHETTRSSSAFEPVPAPAPFPSSKSPQQQMVIPQGAESATAAAPAMTMTMKHNVGANKLLYMNQNIGHSPELSNTSIMGSCHGVSIPDLSQQPSAASQTPPTTITSKTGTANRSQMHQEQPSSDANSFVQAHQSQLHFSEPLQQAPPMQQQQQGAGAPQGNPFDFF